MKEFNITTLVREVGRTELSPDDCRLINTAKDMAAGAYAPYSKFCVGAAILMADGSVVGGNNQENIAYPSGMCAERTAVFHASASKPGVAMRKIAIAAGVRNEADGSVKFQKNPISPCGGCRQALLEYEKLYGSIEVILYGEDKIYVLPSVASLLPLSFTEF